MNTIKKFDNFINIVAHQEKICPENMKTTEKLFSNKDIVINALDNIKARLFVDELCLKNQLPLFESGTQGMKGNTQPVIPFLTENYGDSNDAPQEKSFPLCTIKNFPNQIQHTVHWARDNFEYFNRAFSNVNKYSKDKNFYKNLSSYESNLAKKDIYEILVKYNPKSFIDCIRWAVDWWAENFRNPIIQLLHNFPKDHVKENGNKFWSEGKRCPEIMEYDLSNIFVLEFIHITTKLLCNCCKFYYPFNIEDTKKFILDNKIKPKEYVINYEKVIAVKDSEIKNEDIKIQLPED